MNATPLLTIAGVPVFRDPDGSIRFTAGLALDADGDPMAYHHDSRQALDYLANAGGPGNWWALACDATGQPYVQMGNDPAPGFYVSTTALMDPRFAVRDPRRYVPSGSVPYIVIPGGKLAKFGVRLGNVVTVRHTEFDHSVEAIVADVGPGAKLGEGSIALAKALGINADPKRGGTERRVVEYRIHPGTKSGLWPKA